MSYCVARASFFSLHFPNLEGLRQLQDAKSSVELYQEMWCLGRGLYRM